MLFALKHDDAHLVERVLAGEREAYAPLVRRYLPAVHAIGRSRAGNFAEAEDIAQEAFLAAYNALDTLHEPAKFGPWLLRIARNKANDWLTGRTRERRLTAHFEEAAEPVQDTMRELEIRDMRAMLRRRVEALDDDFREVLFMHYFAGVKTREMAQLLEISHAAVRKRLQRAREALGATLLDELGRDRESEKRLEKRALSIIGAVAGASASWEHASVEAGTAATAAAGSSAAAMAAATSGMTIGGLQMLVGFLSSNVGVAVVAAVAVFGGVAGFVSLQNNEEAVPSATPVSAMAPPAVSGESAEGGAPLPQRQRMASVLGAPGARAGVASVETTQPTGPYGIAGKVDKPGATVRLERVTRDGFECEQDEAVVMAMKPGDDGAFLFEDLPRARYVVLAYTEDAAAFETASADPYDPEPFLEMSLLPAARIRGRVADASGRGIAGAVIYAHACDHEEGELPLGECTAARVTTDGAGGFATMPLFTGKWQFLVRAEGYESLLTEFIEAGSEDVEWVLGVGNGIAGTVVERVSRTPLAKIPLRVESTALKRERFYAISGEGGTFSVAGLREGDYTLVADDAEWISSGEPVAFTVTAGHDAGCVDVPVEPGGLVMGRVTDADSGEPLAGVSIFTYPRPREIVPHRETLSDTDGSYLLTGLPSGSYNVCWAPPDGYPQPFNNINAKEIHVVAGETMSGVDFALSHGIRLTGKVVDADGNPVPRAKVNCVIGQSYHNHVACDKAGRFLLPGLPPTTGLELIARKHGQISAPVGPLTISLEGNAPLTIQLGPAGAIKGAATDEAGRPLAKAEIYVSHHDAPRLGWNRVRTNEDGAFSVAGLLPGPTSVRVTPREMNINDGTEYEDIVVPAGGTLDGLRLVFRPKADPADTGVIAGRVVDKTGKPIEGATVRIQQLNTVARTSANGTFELTGLRQRKFDILFGHRDHSVATVLGIATGTRNLSVTLLGLTEVQGKVIDADTKQPVTSFNMYERGDMELSRLSDQMQQLAQRFRDDKGRFNLTRVPVRDTFLYTWADGYAWKKTPISITTDEQPLTGVVIELKRGAVIEGEVVTPGGKPAPGALLFTGALPHTVYRDERNVGHTNTEGGFRLDTVEESVRCITALMPGYAPGYALVSPVGGETRQVTITLNPGGVLKGTLGVATVPGEVYSLGVDIWHPFEPAFGTSGMNVNPDGTYELANLPAGEVLIRGMAWFKTPDGTDNHFKEYKRALIEPGRETVVDFVFSEGTAAVEGRVTLDGETPAHGYVRLCNQQDHWGGKTSAHLDENGRYRLEGLHPGNAVLHFDGGREGEPSRYHLETVSVKAGETTTRDVDLTGTASISGMVSGAQAGMQVVVCLLQGRHAWPTVPWNLSATYAQEALVRGVGVKEDGTYAMSGVDAGDYTLCASSTIPLDNYEEERVAMPCAITHITVQDGEQAVVNLQLR